MNSVSVVLVSYRTGPLLFDSIASVLSHRSVSQVVVVDNGNPAAVLCLLRKRFAVDSRFQLLSGHGNVGFASGCNLGAEKATGELLLFLNPDCIIPEGGFDRLLMIVGCLEGKWLLAPRLLNPDGTEQQGGRREILTPWMALVEGLRLYKLFPDHPLYNRFNLNNAPLPDSVSEIPVTSGACMLLKASDYRAIGGMDEGYFLHVEDIDFCVRFRKAGGKIYFCPDVSFTHALGTSEASTAFVEKHKLAGFKRYFRIHFGDAYPAGFIVFVNTLLSARYFAIVAKEFVLQSLSKIGWKVRGA